MQSRSLPKLELPVYSMSGGIQPESPVCIFGRWSRDIEHRKKVEDALAESVITT